LSLCHRKSQGKSNTISRVARSRGPFGSAFRSILDGNPFVDAIWEIPVSGRAELDSAWRTFEPLARRKVKNHQFDRAFFTQLGPNNYQNFDGTIRASIFRGYPFPVTVPVTPVLRLSPGEIETVRSSRRNIILETTNMSF